MECAKECRESKRSEEERMSQTQRDAASEAESKTAELLAEAENKSKMLQNTADEAQAKVAELTAAVVKACRDRDEGTELFRLIMEGDLDTAEAMSQADASVPAASNAKKEA